MRRPVLLDTGPLVAALDRRDRYHSWAKDQFFRFPAPFLTCEAVITEACFLLRKLSDGPQAVIKLLRREVMHIPFRLLEESEVIANLLEQYSDLPMSFADACLVRMAETNSKCAVLTMDQDFKVYRKFGRSPIPTIMPEKTAK